MTRPGTRKRIIPRATQAELDLELRALGIDREAQDKLIGDAAYAIPGRGRS